MVYVEIIGKIGDIIKDWFEWFGEMMWNKVFENLDGWYLVCLFVGNFGFIV